MEIQIGSLENEEFIANLVVRNCLSRRKRKLSALYLATVGFGATEDPHYPQQEQAFLDANDLSKYVHYPFQCSGLLLSSQLKC